MSAGPIEITVAAAGARERWAPILLGRLTLRYPQLTAASIVGQALEHRDD